MGHTPDRQSSDTDIFWSRSEEYEGEYEEEMPVEEEQ